MKWFPPRTGPKKPVPFIPGSLQLHLSFETPAALSWRSSGSLGRGPPGEQGDEGHQIMHEGAGK